MGIKPHLVAIVVEGGQAVMGRPAHSDVMPGAVCGGDACCVVADAALILHDGYPPASNQLDFNMYGLKGLQVLRGCGS